DFPRSLAAYRMADVLLVNPIRDGMNLVAKEGPVLSERGCALVLSTEAGAADELGADALLVNPYDVVETAEALHTALSMPAEGRSARGARLAEAAPALPPARGLRRQLAALRWPGRAAPPAPALRSSPVPWAGPERRGRRRFSRPGRPGTGSPRPPRSWRRRTPGPFARCARPARAWSARRARGPRPRCAAGRGTGASAGPPRRPGRRA